VPAPPHVLGIHSEAVAYQCDLVISDIDIVAGCSQATLANYVDPDRRRRDEVGAQRPIPPVRAARAALGPSRPRSIPVTAYLLRRSVGKSTRSRSPSLSQPVEDLFVFFNDSPLSYPGMPCPFGRASNVAGPASAPAHKFVYRDHPPPGHKLSPPPEPGPLKPETVRTFSALLMTGMNSTLYCYRHRRPGRPNPTLLIRVRSSHDSGDRCGRQPSAARSTNTRSASSGAASADTLGA